jgi:hypothetical protein
MHVHRLGRSSRRALCLHPAAIEPPYQTRTPRVHISRACPLPCTKIGYLELIPDRALFWQPASPGVSENGLPPATRCRCRLVLALRFSRQGACNSAVLWLTDRDALQALDADTAGRSYWPLTSS